MSDDWAVTPLGHPGRFSAGSTEIERAGSSRRGKSAALCLSLPLTSCESVTKSSACVGLYLMRIRGGGETKSSATDSHEVKSNTSWLQHTRRCHTRATRATHAMITARPLPAFEGWRPASTFSPVATSATSAALHRPPHLRCPHPQQLQPLAPLASPPHAPDEQAPPHREHCHARREQATTPHHKPPHL